MDKKEQAKILQNIQDELEKMKGTETDIVFMSSTNNRGVIYGTVEGIAALLLYNMVRYPVFKEIVDLAYKKYPMLKDRVAAEADNNPPTHEIVECN